MKSKQTSGFFIVLIVLLASFQANAITNQWTGAAGDFLWSSAGNWSLGTVPAPEHDVLIGKAGTYTVSVDTAAVVSSVKLGGTSGTQTLDLLDLLSLTNGTVTTKGIINLSGGSLNVESNLNVSGGMNWNSGSVSGNGTTTVLNGGKLKVLGGGLKSLFGSIKNQGVFTWNSDAALDGSNATLRNEGTMLLQANCTLTTSSSAVFVNTGTVQQPTNTVSTFQSSWATTNAGIFRADPNAVMQLSGQFNFINSSSITGSGTVQNTGTIGGDGTVNVSGTLELNGGTIGGNHVFTGTGKLNWNYGYFYSLGPVLDTTTFATNFHVFANGPDFLIKNIFYHQIVNRGVFTTDPSGATISGDSAAFSNVGSIVLNGGLNLMTFSSASFLNTGTVLQPTNTTAVFQSSWASTNSGIFRADPNAVMQLSGQINFINGSSITGSGTVENTGTIGGDGTVNVSGTLELNGGTIGGNHTFTGTGKLNWNYGYFYSLGPVLDTTTFATNFHVFANGPDFLIKNIFYHQIVNRGVFTTDPSGATISGDSAAFSNVGSIVLNGGLNLMTFSSASFLNTGTVLQPTNTTAVFQSSWASTNSGIFRADTNAVMQLSGQFNFINGSSITGSGKLQNTGTMGGDGTVNVSGTLELNGGTIGGNHTFTGTGKLNWSYGYFYSLGPVLDTTTFATNFHVNANGPDFLIKNIFYHQIVNRGVFTVDAAGARISGDSAAVNNIGSMVLNGNLHLVASSSASFLNTGTVLQPTNTTAIFQSSWAGTNSGVFRADTNAVMQLSGQFNFINGSSITGSGTVQNTGTIGGDGTVNVGGTLELNGGTIGGNHTLTGTGKLNWNYGYFYSLGPVIETTTFATNFHVYANGPEFLIKNIFNHEIVNRGVFTIDAAGARISGDSATFNNMGSIVLNGGLYLATYTSSSFENTGTVLQPTNTTAVFQSSWASTNSGIFRADTNAVMQLSGQFNFINGSSITGSGMVQNTGTIGGDGTVNVSGTLELNGGTIGGNHTFAGTGRLNWNYGYFYSLGPIVDTTTFATNFHVFANGPETTLKNIFYHDIVNQGVFTIDSAGVGIAGDSSTFSNDGSVVLNGNLDLLTFTSASFENTGTVLQPANSSSLFQCSWAGTNAGSFRADTNAVLQLSGQHNFVEGSSIDGVGTVENTGVIGGDGNVMINGNLELFGGTIGGNHAFNGTGKINWRNGWFMTLGPTPETTILGTNITMNLTGVDFRTLYGHTIQNQGTINFAEGSLDGNAAAINNAGKFSLRTNITLSASGPVTFSNLLSGVLENAAGDNTMTWPFDNAGKITVDSGAFWLYQPYSPPASAVHEFVLSNYNQGSLNIQNFEINGTLAVVLTNGFTPTNESLFEVITFLSRSNEFSHFQFPTLPGHLGWKVEYTDHGLFLHVREVPTILTQPLSKTVDQGTNVTLQAVVSGAPPINLQWRRNGVDLVGETNNFISFTNVQPVSSGIYSLVVSNDMGIVVSSNAVLTVVPDSKAPAVTITSPKANGRTNAGLVTVSGLATDSVRVTQVFYNLNQGDFFPLAITNGGKSVYWSTNLDLIPGTNIFAAKAIDMAGNESLPTTRMIFYVVSNAVTVITNGNGFVSITNGQLLEIGTAYKITATPGLNNVFSNWSGSVTGNSPTVTFLMTNDTVIQANFVPNPFIPTAGIYNGLFSETNRITHQTAGSIQVTVNTNFTCSGKLMLDGDTVSFSGKFDLAGNVTIPVSRVAFGKSNLTVTLNLDVANGTDQILGVVSNSFWIAPLQADRAVWTPSRQALDFTSTNTFLVSGFTNPADGPTDYSYGSIAIPTNGIGTLSGGLADGSVLSRAVPISKNGQWPLYLPLYPQKEVVTVNSVLKTNINFRGSVFGWLTYSNQIFQGDVSWTKTGWTNALYSTGFTNQSPIIASKYIAPAVNVRLLDITNATISITDGNLLAPITNSFVLTTNNLAKVATTNNRVTITFATKTGLFKGSFLDPARGPQLVPFGGALLQDQNFGGGSFNGTNQNGRVLIQAE